jgi:SAM-dependent methyltransferase
MTLGAILGSLAAAVTYVLIRDSRKPDPFATLVERAADRYASGLVSWEFARSKLRADPIYRAVACEGLLTPADRAAPVCAIQPGGTSTLVDIGCGMGLTLAVLAEAQRAETGGSWPAAWPPPPRFGRMIGIEVRSRIAAIAAAALGSDAIVVADDARSAVPSRVDAALLFDVLHLMRREDQNALVATLASALHPNGVVLVREADAGTGWRFTAVRWGNRLKAVAFGAWRQPFCFRTASEWRDCFASHGLHTEALNMSAGTPFANVLFVVTSKQVKPRA